jgi:hypothetical protein
MNRSILAIAALALSTTMASAQNTAAPTPSAPANAPRPAATAPATPSPVAAPQAFGGARNTATSPELARQAFAAGMQAKQANCSGKGPLYKWVPAHTVGEANPKGGFYSNTFGGGCRKIGLSEAIAKGAVTIRQ